MRILIGDHHQKKIKQSGRVEAAENASGPLYYLQSQHRHLFQLSQKKKKNKEKNR